MSISPTYEAGNPRIWVGIGLFILALAAIPLITFFEYAPLQDYSEWIFQGQVFNAIAAGTPSAFAIKNYPVPYAISQVVISAVLLAYSPFVTSKIVLVIYLLAGAGATYVLVSRCRLDAGPACLYLLAAAILNSCFWSGYIGYQIGILVFMLYVAVPAERRCDAIVVAGFSLVLFFTHGLVFVSFCVTAGIYALATRRLTSLVAGMIPCGLLTLWYLARNTTSAVPPESQVLVASVAELLQYKVYTFLKTGPYQDLTVGGVGDARVLRALPLAGLGANALFCLGVALAVAASLWPSVVERRLPQAGTLAALVLIVLAIVMPPSAAGIVNPGERLLYPSLVLLCVPLFARPRRPLRLVGRGVGAVVLAGLALTLVSEFTLAAKVASARAASGAAEANRGIDRILFGHRPFVFDAKMRATQAAWLAHGVPDEALAFDTALLKGRR